MKNDLLRSVRKICETAVDTVDKGMQELNRQLDPNVKRIRVPSDASQYYHRNYEEVFDEFEAYGFKDIVLLEQKDLTFGVFVHDGAVEQVSIDGKANFKQNQRFDENSRVVIIYHTFRP
ncbi:hypothetical protein [Floccifex sp.]|uniref:hypothetical protein n=1 Tax=Floccifex sp. TaxID=2815810 RepID=UPI002A749BAD|nr:hypothetical protein [Floccifex sp.]MDD7282054.1 hypothetical protein [Erysipelotrichaceae bacterium]MDY2957899.1 hypothetical protein [Floccifex sp.]